MISETAAAGGGSAPRTIGRSRIDRKKNRAKAQKILEFAWGSEVLDLNCEEFADLMLDLFPQAYADKPAVQRTIEQLRNRKAKLFPA